MNINKIYKMKNSKLITKTVLLSVAMAGVITSCQKDEISSKYLSKFQLIRNIVILKNEC